MKSANLYSRKKEVISLLNVSKHYSDVRALDKVNLKIASGEKVALFGANGSGKSTILNVINNSASPDTGDIFVFGKKIRYNQIVHRFRMGYLNNPYSFMENYTVQDYLRLVGDIKNLVADEEFLGFMTDALSLDQFLNKRISGLSTGNKKKVALLVSMMGKPEVLLLDEPFANLDSTTVTSLELIISKYLSECSLLIASHHLDICLKLCDIFYQLHNGEIIRVFYRRDYESNDQLLEHIKRETV
ncbi:ATP-binding cassette domain-containing protein [Neolewinella antarctica]|uniref:ABC-2 type transport system ATP-binding protein n=1 Tax=Neolewinella antarctica TaxID=442734 RepID=A0ABX0XCS3_9BACT|nr:ABC transporter ATP-binding protein [Neolewinella antarctica]NJC26870.1 ABC-2 type transport system ATP-binding protein [Neolewinella antarctica]